MSPSRYRRRVSLAAIRILAVFVALVVLPWLAKAQPPPGRTWRVGLLSPSSAAASAHLVAAFREGLRDRGFIESQNLAIEYRWAEGDASRLPALAKELVSAGVDILVSPTPPATRAAKSATSTIPIVMLNVGDPVGAGLVADLARPGGNITGQTNDEPRLGEKLVALVREMAPGVQRLGVLRNPQSPVASIQLREIEAASRSAGLEVRSFEAREPGQFETVVQAIAEAGVGVLLVRADPMFFAPRKRLAELAITKRIPTLFERREYAEAGGLIGYGPSLTEQFRHAATFVDRILKGARPAELPIEPPSRTELVVNLKTATALGVTVPPSLLTRAEEVIR